MAKQGIAHCGVAGAYFCGEAADEPGHFLDGIDAQMWFGAVRGPAIDSNIKSHRALVCAHDFEFGRLGDDRAFDRDVFGEVVGAGEEGFLVDGAGVEDGARWGNAGFFEALYCVDHRRAAGLGVAGAAAVEQAVFDLRLEGRNGHHLGRGGVHMAFEEQGAVGVRAGECRDDIVAAGQDFAEFEGDVERGEEVGEIGDHAGLALAAAGQGGVDAVDGDEVLQGGEDGVVAAGPTHIAAPRRRAAHIS